MTHSAVEVQDELRRLRQESRDAQIAVLHARAPEIYADARRFLAVSHYLPWEIAAAFAEGLAGDLTAKYNAPPARHRPAASTVAPETDLFCAACALLTQPVE